MTAAFVVGIFLDVIASERVEFCSSLITSVPATLAWQLEVFLMQFTELLQS